MTDRPSPAMDPPSAGRVTLNVGGVTFTTTTSTLLTLPNTRLGRIAATSTGQNGQMDITGQIGQKDKNGQNGQMDKNGQIDETALNNPNLNTTDQTGTTSKNTTTTTTTTATTTTTTTATTATPGPTLELFFDRNPDMVNSVLDLYRTGELHFPSSLCPAVVTRELHFWEVPEDLLRECCFRHVDCHREDARIVDQIDRFLTWPFETPADVSHFSTWNRLWLIMEQPKLCRAAKVWSAVYFTVVFLSVLFYTFETSMSFRDFHPWFIEFLAYFNVTVSEAVPNMTLMEQYNVSETTTWLKHVQEACLVFFFVEFAVRLAACPTRRYFVRQAKNWFDFFLVLHNLVSVLLENVVFKLKENWTETESNAIVFFYSLSVLRVMRIFYIAKHFDSMKMLLLSTKASAKVLLLLSLCTLSMAAMFGSAVWLTELLTDDFTFSSIPFAMWYALVTMTTVGYGDVYPVSTPGRLVGVLCALCGVIVMALPIAVIASRFQAYHDNLAARQQLKKRLNFLFRNPLFLRPAWASLAESAEQTNKDKSGTYGGRTDTNYRRGKDFPHRQFSPVDNVWFTGESVTSPSGVSRDGDCVYDVVKDVIHGINGDVGSDKAEKHVTQSTRKIQVKPTTNDWINS